MAHSYVNVYVHYIFGTKNRKKIITPQLEERLWPYMGGIAARKQNEALAIGGMEEHAHVFLLLPSTLAISKAIQLIKGGSSTWVSKTFSDFRDFQWQEGYSALSIGVSQIENTVHYIHNQKEHHKKQTFQEEYIAILKSHGIKYDERYLWG